MLIKKQNTMITCMIYISNDNESLDANVGIEIKLPCLPRIKDELFLTDEQISELEEMAKSDFKISENHYGILGHLIWKIEGRFYCDKNGMQLKYVHQLQNLYFALTGSELTVV